MASSRVQSTFAVTDEELTELLTNMQLPGAVDSLEDIVTLSLTDDLWENLGKVAKVVEYQGFDPKKMANQIAEKLPIFTTQPLVSLTLGAVTCKCTETATTLDVPFLITLFLVRGNAVHKILATTSTEVKNVITRKCNSLGISTSKRAATDRLLSTTVTLARLSQAFPQVTAAIIINHEIDGKLQPKWLMGSTLPRLMQHSIFSAIIPADEAFTNELQTIAVALNLEMTVMLQVPKEKRKMENREISELEESSLKYVLAAMNGGVCTKKVQLRILKAAGIINSNGALEGETIVIHGACNRFLSRKDSSYKDAVRTMVAEAPRPPQEAAQAKQDWAQEPRSATTL